MFILSILPVGFGMDDRIYKMEMMCSGHRYHSVGLRLGPEDGDEM